MQERKWVCNKCGFITYKQPEHKNSTCLNCGKGRNKLICTCECGKEFHPEHYGRKHCSKECQYLYMPKGGKKGKKYPHTQRARIAICEVCGKEFRAIHDTKERKSKYCSKECWSKRRTVIIQCVICGKDMKLSQCQTIHRKTCSVECSNEYRKEYYKGEKSPAWKGGKTKESKLRRTCSEYRKWRTAVFERDNYTCQRCGKSDNTLEAHHIKEQSQFPELIYDVDNGLTLCHECHKLTDNYGNKAKRFISYQYTGQKAVKIEL